ncbi:MULTISPECIES: ArsR/SmtB family transcription factor [Aerococcus]|uniref:ArsR/SmtB family transcription factor n=1 Tax=Aerococcus TaxID=1375 RepID=UPI000845D925|nr:metalloregulator ArsR/SmtB family transcription factor [Aerococcus urinaeequi]
MKEAEEHLEDLHGSVEPEQIQHLSKMFKALGDPTRLRILYLLGEGEMMATKISEELGLEQSAVSHQLKKLFELRLVKKRKERNTVIYSQADSHVLQILTDAFTHIKEEDDQ